MGFPHWLGDSPRCSQTFHNRSHCAPVPFIRDPSYSEGRQECPPRVWFSPEIDSSNFTLRLLSHTPGGSQWLKYILLMYSPICLVPMLSLSKIEFRHWYPLGVFGGFWTTIWEWLNYRVNWTDTLAVTCTCECWWQDWENTGGVVTTSEASGNTANQPESTFNSSIAVWDKQHNLWKWCWCTWKS